MYNQGISRQADILNVGVKFGVINKAGNSYTFGDTKLGIGREAAKNYLKENENIMKDIREKVIDKIRSGEEVSLVDDKEEPPKATLEGDIIE